MTLYTKTKYQKSINDWNQKGISVYNCLWYLATNDQETLVKLSEEILIEMIKEERGLVTDQVYANCQQLTMSYKMICLTTQ